MFLYSKNFFEKFQFYRIFCKSEISVQRYFYVKAGSITSGFSSQKPEVRPPKKAFGFQVHYGHSKGNTPDGEKPRTVRRTLKTEYHSLGQNNETSVIRGLAIKKAGWLKSQ